MTTAVAEPLTVSSGAELINAVIAKSGPARRPATDMDDLAAVLRRCLAIDHGLHTRERLGGSRFDVVITGADDKARAVVAAMDEIQGGCAGVLVNPGPGWFYWLVPPGSADRWAPHPHAVCLGASHTIKLPPLNHQAPPGPYWYRPLASDRRVPAGPLWDLLAKFQPGSPPHRALADRGITA
ncbi:hypothetical protein ACFVFF_07615 [Streptomyces sp. NPDC057680]|uniref:hypothetical protein n=1 Tax=Streptomyces sp. NPDC057680 TaxID=3346208 RepID=UPI0036BD6FEC